MFSSFGRVFSDDDYVSPSRLGVVASDGTMMGMDRRAGRRRIRGRRNQTVWAPVKPYFL